MSLRIIPHHKVHTKAVYERAQQTRPSFVIWNWTAQCAWPASYKNVLSDVYPKCQFVCGLDSALKLMHFLSLESTRNSRAIILLTLRHWPSYPIAVTSGWRKDTRRKLLTENSKSSQVKPQLRWARESWWIHIICYKSCSLSAETSVQTMQLRMASVSTRPLAASEGGGWLGRGEGGRAHTEGGDPGATAPLS